MNTSSINVIHRDSKGFTLTELLIVIGIIILLVALLFPVISRVQAGSKRMECASNLRQIGIFAHQYARDNDGEFPTSQEPSLGRWHPTTSRGLVDLLEPYLAPTGTFDEGMKVFYCTEGRNTTYEQQIQRPLSLSSRPNNRFREIGYYWILSRKFPFSYTPVVPRKTIDLKPSYACLAMCVHFAGHKKVHDNNINCLFADGHVESRKGDQTGVLLPYVDPETLELTRTF